MGRSKENIMKKYLLLILILLIPTSSWGAIAAATVWEVRTAGVGTNGCGFNPSNATPGTDFSVQDAAQDSGTDLATADGIPASGGCIVTSATHNFVDADEGNLIHITEAGDGFTVGWYEIVSTDTNAATLDRACGTDGAKTGGDWAYGGACDLDSSTYSSEIFAAMTAGNTIYILGYAGDAVDYTPGEAITVTAGTDGVPINIIGYITSRTTVPTGTNRPSIDMEANALTTGNYNSTKNIIFTGTAATMWNASTSSIVFNCKATNTSGTANRVALTSAVASIFNSEFSSTNGYCLQFTNASFVYGSYIHDSTSKCVNVGGSSVSFINNIFDTCGISGIYANAAARNDLRIIGNTFYGADDADAEAIDLANGNKWLVVNNIFANWYEAIAREGAQLIEDYNMFYSNEADGVTLGPNSVAEDPGFTDAANANFTVGANAKAQGYPDGGSLPGTHADGKGYTDIGALQRIEPTGTGGGASAW
jgi:hypothetical protein